MSSRVNCHIEHTTFLVIQLAVVVSTIHLCGVGQNAQVCTREQQQHATLHEKPSCPILTARAIQVQPPFRYPMDVREEHCQWEIQQQQNITWLHETPIRQRRAPRQLLSSQTSSP